MTSSVGCYQENKTRWEAQRAGLMAIPKSDRTKGETKKINSLKYSLDNETRYLESAREELQFLQGAVAWVEKIKAFAEAPGIIVRQLNLHIFLALEQKQINHEHYDKLVIIMENAYGRCVRMH